VAWRNGIVAARAGKIEDDLWFFLWRIEFVFDGGEGAED
jgi:hypothetical protein